MGQAKISTARARVFIKDMLMEGAQFSKVVETNCVWLDRMEQQQERLIISLAEVKCKI